MSFNLGKPPIIEAWIRATMVAAPDSEWNWADVDQMLRTYRDDLSEFEHLPEFTPKAKSMGENQLPMEIEIHVEPRYLRARTTDRSRLVQVGRNELMVLRGRSDSQAYPGFHKLLEEFLLAAERYRDHIPSVGVTQAELHYVDLVVVPDMYNEQSSPSDYFVGAPEVPLDPFGTMTSVSWSVSLSRPDATDAAQLSVQMQPPDGADGRFRLDWHCSCTDLPPDDMAAIAEQLTSAHNYLVACFRAVCQPTVWQLFDPT